jgi:ribosome-binding protein aMBF1 (putative translation factor)
MNHDEVKQRLLDNPEVRRAYENPPLRLQVARAVVEWRHAMGKSQQELAELLRTSQNQVYRIESGDANITLKTLEKLESIIGLRFTVEERESPTPVHRRHTLPVQ